MKADELVDSKVSHYVVTWRPKPLTLTAAISCIVK